MCSTLLAQSRKQPEFSLLFSLVLISSILYLLPKALPAPAGNILQYAYGALQIRGSELLLTCEPLSCFCPVCRRHTALALALLPSLGQAQQPGRLLWLLAAWLVKLFWKDLSIVPDDVEPPTADREKGNSHRTRSCGGNHQVAAWYLEFWWHGQV